MQTIIDQTPAILSSIQGHLAMIMFDTQGRVSWVNENFAATMGYEVDEMVGLQHRTFCLPELASSGAYVELWDGLRQGKAFQDKIVRVTKTGELLTLEATYMPFFIENRVEGVIKIATDITKREHVLRESTSGLMAMVEEMTANTDEVLDTSNKIAASMINLTKDSETVRSYIESIQFVTTVVKDIANQSHLLGLNAAIEAARAGEGGRGFEVVANEIRKMASSSKQSVETISEQLEQINDSMLLMMKQIDEITSQVTNNSMAIRELKKAYDHIAVNTETLASSI